MTVSIDKYIDNPEVRLGALLAELVRQGVRFTVQDDTNEYVVVLTGGF